MAHFGYWNLVSDPKPNKVVKKNLNRDAPKVPKQVSAKRDGVINSQNYIFTQS